MVGTVSSRGLRAPRLLERRVDRVGADERAARFRARSVKAGTEAAALRLAVAMCDLTTLEGGDTPGRVGQLCRKARSPMAGYLGPALAQDVPPVAAVCVYPNRVADARRALAGSPVKVASVATGFPAGQTPLRQRLEEVRQAVSEGADEVDVVINREALLTGDTGRVFDEVAAAKEACGEARLKAILETGEIGPYDAVRRAALIAMEAGADFVKTSTGKLQPAATMPVALVMLEAIHDFFDETGTAVGMKPAGGIRSAKDALHYLVMVGETLGPAWLKPSRFRFGASALLNDLLMQIVRLETGVYPRPEDFGGP